MEHTQKKHMLTIYYEGNPYSVPAGISVASALINFAHVSNTGLHPISHTPRSPHCMIGVCHECLMEIDGIPHCQACLTTVRDGMHIQHDRPIEEMFNE